MQNPFARLLGYLLVVSLVLFIAGKLLTPHISALFQDQSIPGELLTHLLRTVLLVTIYMLMISKVENRPVYEFSRSSVIAESTGGFLIGGFLIGLVIIILSLAGYYHIQHFNSAKALIHGFILFGYGAFFEELIFRLIIFKLLEEYFGSWISVIVSAAFFGAAHLFNQHANLWSAIAIAIEAGVLLSMAFIFTRRIWMVMAIHFAWNFLQASVFGLPASGMDFPGLISAEITGPAWLTGGDFGIEASPITVIFGLLTALFLLKKAYHDDQLILPAWRINKRTEIRY